MRIPTEIGHFQKAIKITASKPRHYKITLRFNEDLLAPTTVNVRMALAYPTHQRCILATAMLWITIQ